VIKGSDEVRVNVRGAVLEVTVDRPKANAFGARTSRLMSEIFAEFRDDPAYRAASQTPTSAKAVGAGCRSCPTSVSR
jgi:crotonobetainyl-CoA hydratase